MLEGCRGHRSGHAHRAWPPGSRLAGRLLLARVRPGRQAGRHGGHAVVAPGRAPLPRSGVGELVRRVTGEPFPAWFAEHVAGPLGLDFWFGLPQEHDDRVAVSVWAAGLDGFAQEGLEAAAEPGSYAARRLAAIAELPPMDPDPHDAGQRRAYYGADVPGAHGITNARSLARMYAATLGAVDGVRLLTEETRALATRPRTDDLPALIESGTAGPDIRFGLGFQLSSPSMPGFGPRSYGHTGAGARLAIADPDLDVSFAYVCNSMRMIGAGGDPRWRALIDAVRSCLT